MVEVKDTLVQRGSMYGSFLDNANCTQALMDVIHKHAKRPLEAFEIEALHMNMHKVSRIIIGQRTKKDNWHDIAGYATLAEEQTTDQ